MMGLTKDGQVNQQLLSARDKRMNVSTEEKKKSRQDIPMPTVSPGANSWESGKTPQLKADTVDVKNMN